ncbi:MAG TPA: ATP synthase F1 subunit epsilon [Deltaproteobacteria bacterium]|nr:ATP synthase F1 subunit epsilon [Deltaproteobacteria bacterium]HOM28167.1 ATP synthase F1 subunit epsilon [Deltaproteobacteria bacterium]HPP79307.1 ATP synthase F1 subunit epsilon [Deltaproteobacteria bacterium]
MAEEYIQVDVVTPEKAVLSRKAVEVVAPGSQGEFGVLIGHTPFLTTLKPGQIIVRTEDRDIYLACGGGFAEVISDRVIILAETAEMAEDLKADELKEEVEQAREKLRQLGKEDPDYEKWEKRLLRAEIKQRVLENWEKNR